MFNPSILLLQSLTASNFAAVTGHSLPPPQHCSKKNVTTLQGISLLHMYVVCNVSFSRYRCTLTCRVTSMEITLGSRNTNNTRDFAGRQRLEIITMGQARDGMGNICTKGPTKKSLPPFFKYWLLSKHGLCWL